MPDSLTVRIPKRQYEVLCAIAKVDANIGRARDTRVVLTQRWFWDEVLRLALGKECDGTVMG